MSLEAKLDALFGAMEANTAALKEVNAAWHKLVGQATTLKAKADSAEIDKISAGGVVVAEVKPEKATRAKKADKPAPDAEVFEPTAAPAAEPAPTPADTDTKVTYADVSAKVLAMLKTDREKVMATLTKFGVPSAKALDEAKWGAFLAELNSDEGLV